MIGFTVRGYDAAGEPAQYPAPDDVLRNTGEPDWPVITEPAEALEEARSACMIAQDWTHAEVYRVEDDGSEVSIGCAESAR